MHIVDSRDIKQMLLSSVQSLKCFFWSVWLLLWLLKPPGDSVSSCNPEVYDFVIIRLTFIIKTAALMTLINWNGRKGGASFVGESELQIKLLSFFNFVFFLFFWCFILLFVFLLPFKFYLKVSLNFKAMEHKSFMKRTEQKTLNETMF